MLACTFARLQRGHLILILLFRVTLLRINQIVPLVSLAFDGFEFIDRAHLLNL
jgi:hypothetical protein